MITINGKTYQGSNIQMNNGTIIIDDVIVGGEFLGSAPVIIQGDCNNIETDGSVTIESNVSADGSVKCNSARKY